MAATYYATYHVADTDGHSYQQTNQPMPYAGFCNWSDDNGWPPGYDTVGIGLNPGLSWDIGFDGGIAGSSKTTGADPTGSYPDCQVTISGTTYYFTAISVS